MVLGEILIQTSYYAIVMVLTITVIGLLQRGFFLKYIKAKTSFGKYVLVKIRTQLRDYFAIGWVEDGFLVYKRKKAEYRLTLVDDKKYFYRTLGVNWVDVDEKKGALCTIDYEAVTGHDLQTESDLLVRALTRPNVADNKERIMFGLLIGIILLVLAVAFLSYSNYSVTKSILAELPKLAPSVAITGGNSLI